MASYFGGRSEVRVRKTEVPVNVVDFTSMYPTVFILQNLQELTAAKTVKARDVTAETRKLIETIKLDDLYDHAFWPTLRRIVRFIPNGDVVPVRMRFNGSDPYTIAVTPFTSPNPHWYTFADATAAKLLGKTIPMIDKAYEFNPGKPNDNLHAIDFLGTALDPSDQIFRKVIEDRQKSKAAKNAGGDPLLARRDLALKTLANSGAYGIFAEVNVSPARAPLRKGPQTAQERVWYSDAGRNKGKAHDERPGAFFNPIIASLDTGGARLMLAILEAEVTRAGGTFAFCDTDSLAIVAGDRASDGIPCITEDAVVKIINRFNRLNPYDRNIVPDLLKREFPKANDLRCYAISAKRYVLYQWLPKRRIRIIKASESGIGAAIGRTEGESVGKLARRIWTAILVRDLGIRYRGARKRRMSILCNFDVPFRRRFPITQPRIYDAPGFRNYNRTKGYDFQIKPFGFLQTITPATEIEESVLPIAPFERSVMKSRKLAWTDFRSGKPTPLDWDGLGAMGSVPVMRLDEFVWRYAKHPESKAADSDGDPATCETRGLLGRLHLVGNAPARIGKEVDRLGEDDGDSLWPQTPLAFDDDNERLNQCLSVIAHRPRAEVADHVGISVRRLQDILKGRSKPRQQTLRRLLASTTLAP